MSVGVMSMIMQSRRCRKEKWERVALDASARLGRRMLKRRSCIVKGAMWRIVVEVKRVRNFPQAQQSNRIYSPEGGLSKAFIRIAIHRSPPQL